MIQASEHSFGYIYLTPFSKNKVDILRSEITIMIWRRRARLAQMGQPRPWWRVRPRRRGKPARRVRMRVIALRGWVGVIPRVSIFWHAPRKRTAQQIRVGSWWGGVPSGPIIDVKQVVVNDHHAGCCLMTEQRWGGCRDDGWWWWTTRCAAVWG